MTRPHGVPTDSATPRSELRPVEETPGDTTGTRDWSRYPRSKRVLDLALGIPALIVATPIMIGIRLMMYAAGDRGPFLYPASRVGEAGAPITVFKIRTMKPRSEGTPLTLRNDPRVTRVGRLLRRSNLDELPQLWNVIRGDMALVGPRPEDPSFVDLASPLHRKVFTARPGITGRAQLEYRREAETRDGTDPEREYRDHVLPAKLQLDAEYLDQRSVALDLRLLVRTALAIVRPGR